MSSKRSNKQRIAADGTDLIDPSVIIQFSDLHFGRNSRFANFSERELRDLADHCCTAVRQSCEDLGWNERVGIVLVTGDITEGARPPEFASAMVFFAAFAERLAVARSSFVFLPGNHDVSWAQCRAVEGELSDETFPDHEYRARLDAVKLKRFNEAIARFYDPDWKEGPRRLPPSAGRTLHELPIRHTTPSPPEARAVAYIHDFPDLGIAVAALDSCEMESHRPEDHKGSISKEQAQAVLDHFLRADTPKERIRILALHHNPVSTTPENVAQWVQWLRGHIADGKITADTVEQFAADAVGLEGRDLVRRLSSSAQVSFVFHGHHHASLADDSWPWRGSEEQSGNAHVISAGSWGLAAEKLPKEQPAVIQLVRIDPGQMSARAVLLRYDPRAHIPGRITTGGFITDEVTRQLTPLSLSLPTAVRGKKKDESARQVLSVNTALAISAYRRRRRGSFLRWDLRGAGALPVGPNGRPIEATLDEMYVPLRFDTESNPDDPGLGAPFPPDTVKTLHDPHIIIGNAGSGKTTWMRWTFRRLIEDQHADALPFIIELRSLVRIWKSLPRAEQTIEHYLSDELTLCGIENASETLVAILENKNDPVPVILVDGWDELGDSGYQLRERLAEFISSYPRVKVVVSSRPYGETRPAYSEGFYTLEVQPLSDPEIEDLVFRYHHNVQGESDPDARTSTQSFLQSLLAVPEAHALARTALLLTMMMLLTREGPLPDRRHRLYDKCLRNLLNARPDQAANEGVEMERRQWRPFDPEERVRVVANFAYSMQSQGYDEGRTQIAVAWDDAERLLPRTWSKAERDGFLAWLLGRAGVLVDRTDLDNDEDLVLVSFAHLSFQEHLVAHHLSTTVDGVQERVAAIQDFVDKVDWWETLRLWAGLVHDRHPAHLSDVFTHIGVAEARRWLVGCFLADGNGQEADFIRWASVLGPVVSAPPDDTSAVCARAWAVSKQVQRREQLVRLLEAYSNDSNWLAAARIQEWCTAASLAIKQPASIVELDKPATSLDAVARARILCGYSPWWPGDLNIVALRLWPTRRARLGGMLQMLSSLGVGAQVLSRCAATLLARAEENESDSYCTYILDLASEIASRGDIPTDLARDYIRELVDSLGMKCVRKLGRYHMRSLFEVCLNHLLPGMRDFQADAHGFAPFSMTGAAREFAIAFLEGCYHVLRDLHAPLRSLAELMYGALDGVEPNVWEEAVILELTSVLGRCSTRVAFAYTDAATTPFQDASLARLLQAACRVSMRPRDAALWQVLQREIMSSTVERTWISLAKVLARKADSADLDALFRRSRTAADASAWGFRSYVAGDIVRKDGTVLTLEEVCGRSGTTVLPILDEMRDESDEPAVDAPEAWRQEETGMKRSRVLAPKKKRITQRPHG